MNSHPKGRRAGFVNCLAGGVALAALAGSPADAWTRPGASGPWVEANQVFLRYKLSGHGADTIVLLHEASMTLDAWDETVPLLESKHRVLRYDLRGFGLSERISGPYALSDAAEDLHGLLDALDIRRPVTLVGGAAGGAIALKFAALHPDRVKRVMVIDPSVRLEPPGEALEAMDAPLPAPQTASQIGDDLYALRARAARPDRFARFQAIMAGNDRASLTATTRMAYAEDFSGILPKVSCPVLVVRASLFTQRSEGSLRALAAAAPKGRFLALPVGRYAAISEPETIGPAIRSFAED